MDSRVRKLPVWGTAVDSWRFLLRRPLATLLTMIVAALCLRAVLGTATLLSRATGPVVPAIDLPPLAVSGIVALSGWLVAAALVMVLWQRAVVGIPVVAGSSSAGSLVRIVGQSAISLAALGALWVASALLMLFPLGARPGIMIVSEMPVEMIAKGDTDRLFDLRLFALSAIMVVAALAPVRLALGLPAVALRRAGGFRTAWSLGRGNSWRLLATLLLALLPVWLAGLVVDPPRVPRVERDWLWWTRSEIDRALNGPLFALAGTVLALSYRLLGGGEQRKEGAGVDGR